MYATSTADLLKGNAMLEAVFSDGKYFERKVALLHC
jgi:hypothetical protein